MISNRIAVDKYCVNILQLITTGNLVKSAFFSTKIPLFNFLNCFKSFFFIFLYLYGFPVQKKLRILHLNLDILIKQFKITNFCLKKKKNFLQK